MVQKLFAVHVMNVATHHLPLLCVGHILVGLDAGEHLEHLTLEHISVETMRGHQHPAGRDQGATAHILQLRVDQGHLPARLRDGARSRTDDTIDNRSTTISLYSMAKRLIDDRIGHRQK